MTDRQSTDDDDEQTETDDSFIMETLYPLKTHTWFDGSEESGR